MRSGNETIAVRPLVIRVGTARLLILVLNESGYKATIRCFTSSHPSSTICLMLFFTNVEPGWRQQTNTMNMLQSQCISYDDANAAGSWLKHIIYIYILMCLSILCLTTSRIPRPPPSLVCAGNEATLLLPVRADDGHYIGGGVDQNRLDL